MHFEKTGLAGAYLVDIIPAGDNRGFFARSYCDSEFAAQGLVAHFVQCNISMNTLRGTLRGLHFQKDPKPEAKLVRCTRGSIYDVIVDLRRTSPTFCQWRAFELTEANHRALYVPAGFAHGFQSLTENSEVLYQMGEFYVPELAGGVRWNDPLFGIPWPINPPILSEKDASFPDFKR